MKAPAGGGRGRKAFCLGTGGDLIRESAGQGGTGQSPALPEGRYSGGTEPSLLSRFAVGPSAGHTAFSCH